MSENGKVDWKAEIERLMSLKDECDQLIQKAVKGARKDGDSWYRLAPSLRVSRQAAMEKFNTWSAKSSWPNRPPKKVSK